MKKLVRIIGMGALLFGSTLALSGWMSSSPTEEWKAPISVNNIKNPLMGDMKAAEKGKKIYKQMCVVCHGDKGKGNGIAGSSLNPRPADFTAENIQAQSDGAIYWKMTEGRAPMAAYKDILKEDQRWQLVNYLRTLKK